MKPNKNRPDPVNKREGRQNNKVPNDKKIPEKYSRTDSKITTILLHTHTLEQPTTREGAKMQEARYRNSWIDRRQGRISPASYLESEPFSWSFDSFLLETERPVTSCWN